MKVNIFTAVLLFVLQGCTHHNLETRHYEVKKEFLQPAIARADAPINDMGDFINMGQQVDIKNPSSEQISLYLEQAGVSRPTGSFLRIDTNSNTMVARNTVSNLTLIENILVPLGKGWILKRKE